LPESLERRKFAIDIHPSICRAKNNIEAMMAKPSGAVTVSAAGKTSFDASLSFDARQTLLAHFPTGSLEEIERRFGLGTPDEELRSHLAMVVWGVLKGRVTPPAMPGDVLDDLQGIASASQALRREIEECLVGPKSQSFDARFLLNMARSKACDPGALEDLEDLASRLAALDEVVDFISNNEPKNVAGRPLTAERYLMIAALRQVEFAVSRRSATSTFQTYTESGGGGAFWTMLRHCEDAIASALRSEARKERLSRGRRKRRTSP
jgi:hypothetical protein